MLPGGTESKAQRMSGYVQPVFLLRVMLQYLGKERIVAPAYKSLQDMVGRVLSGDRSAVVRSPAGAEARDRKAVE